MYEIYYLALKTVGALMTLLMLRPQWLKLEKLSLSEGSSITPECTIKLLVRARKLYEAYSTITKILRLCL